MNRVAVFLATGLVIMGGTPPIRSVPRVVDVTFHSRMELCPSALSDGGVSQANHERRSVLEFLGAGLRRIDVHQVGDSFSNFPAVAQHIRQVMAQRPQHFSRYTPWVEPTPLTTYGILATLQYERERTGRLEIAGTHLCIQDASGTVWWARVGAIDVWPPDTSNGPGGN